VISTRCIPLFGAVGNQEELSLFQPLCIRASKKVINVAPAGACVCVGVGVGGGVDVGVCFVYLRKYDNIMLMNPLLGATTSVACHKRLWRCLRHAGTCTGV